MTGHWEWRSAAGWLRRRLLELSADVLEARSSLPPRRLRARVGAPGPGEFTRGGAALAEALLARAEPALGGPPTAVLDFGCGAGRVLAPLARRLGPAARVCGVDVDAEATAWAAAHLAGVDVRASGALPPLEHPDASFDLVYSISVFSHLDAAAQDAWLAELARVLAPGGRALLSVHGPSALEAFTSGRVSTAWCAPGAFAALAPLERTGFLTVPYRVSRWSRGDLPGVGEGYGLSFHDPAYVRAHWGRWLAIEAILPRAVSGWQDLVIAAPRR
ncbi:MAG TPA: class I SAM-dependent methyltransferase [Solirubrobacteraceae bacterium]|nr:class I SAM-dependent methyltransferase [Solirubrobacteraceae bacterium]